MTPAVSTSVTRICRACRITFIIDASERAWWEDLASREGADIAHLPARCTPCRVAARRARERVLDDGLDEELVCVDCLASFSFAAGQKKDFAARGFARPRRCYPCRAVRALSK